MRSGPTGTAGSRRAVRHAEPRLTTSATSRRGRREPRAASPPRSGLAPPDALGVARQVHGADVATVDGRPPAAPPDGRRRGHRGARPPARGAHRRLRADRARRRPRRRRGPRGVARAARGRGRGRGRRAARRSGRRRRCAPCSARASTRRTTSSVPTTSPARRRGSVRSWSGTHRRRPTRARPPGRRCVRRSPSAASPTSTTSASARRPTPDHFSHRRDGVTGRQAVVVVKE